MAIQETQAIEVNHWETLSRDAQNLWNIRKYVPIITDSLFKNPDVADYLYSKTTTQEEVVLFGAYATRELILTDRPAIKKFQAGQWIELLDYVSKLIEIAKRKLTEITPDGNSRTDPEACAVEFKEKASYFVSKVLLSAKSL